ncbi:mucin-19-like, partial [Varroa jacobsoni]|uniref:mucin-19-like n=1 Tax=Varroa jacobsoni TaxID=62625 RepID=UPI000BFA12E8
SAFCFCGDASHLSSGTLASRRESRTLLTNTKCTTRTASSTLPPSLDRHVTLSSSFVSAAAAAAATTAAADNAAAAADNATAVNVVTASTKETIAVTTAVVTATESITTTKPASSDRATIEWYNDKNSNNSRGHSLSTVTASPTTTTTIVSATLGNTVNATKTTDHIATLAGGATEGSSAAASATVTFTSIRSKYFNDNKHSSHSYQSSHTSVLKNTNIGGYQCRQHHYQPSYRRRLFLSTPLLPRSLALSSPNNARVATTTIATTSKLNGASSPSVAAAAAETTVVTTAASACSSPAASTSLSRVSSSAPPTPSPLRRTRRQSTLYSNPLSGTGTPAQSPARTPRAGRRASPSHRGRVSPSSAGGLPYRTHLLLTMDGARPVYNYYHPSHGSSSAMSNATAGASGVGGGAAASARGIGGSSAGCGNGHRRPSAAARRSTIRSQASARSRRRASSARSSRQGGSNLMDRQCALILMYGIYFFYVLACFGAISTFAGLMLRISSKQPDAHDKGKIISGVGIGICCTCFLIAFYCRSVKLDDKIFESIKETAPIVEIDDLILQRVGSAYYYNPQPPVERRPTIASSAHRASWWQMRHGDADEISIYSGGVGTRPGSAASSIIGQGSHAFHPHIIIPRGFQHAEYIPASEVCSSVHSSPLHGSSPGPQTPLSFMSIDIPEEAEPDLERPSTSRVSIG